MTLHQIVAAHPALFYPQTWWHNQAFASEERAPWITGRFHAVHGFADQAGELPYAVSLANIYVGWPDLPIWRCCLWTADFDDHGNRVFVGGLGMDGIESFQIHRALNYAELCMIPVRTL